METRARRRMAASVVVGFSIFAAMPAFAADWVEMNATLSSFLLNAVSPFVFEIGERSLTFVESRAAPVLALLEQLLTVTARAGASLFPTRVLTETIPALTGGHVLGDVELVVRVAPRRENAPVDRRYR